MNQFQIELVVYKILSPLIENERYYNWYRGFTKIENPFKMENPFEDCNFKDLTTYHKFYTAASSGTIFSKDLGLKSDGTNVEVKIFVPDTMNETVNLQLSLDLEEMPDNGSDVISDVISFNNEQIDVQKFSKTISNATGSYRFRFDLSYGFQYKWFYNDDAHSQSKYIEDEWTVEFVRYN